MGYDWHATTLPTVCCECLCLYLWLGGTACVAIAWKLTFNHIHITTSPVQTGLGSSEIAVVPKIATLGWEVSLNISMPLPTNPQYQKRKLRNVFSYNDTRGSGGFHCSGMFLSPLWVYTYSVTRGSWAFPNLRLKAKGAHNVVNWSTGASSLLKGELSNIQGSHFRDFLRNCAHQNMLLFTACLGGIFANVCIFSKNVGKARSFQQMPTRIRQNWPRFWTRCLHTLSTSQLHMPCCSAQKTLMLDITPERLEGFGRWVMIKARFASSQMDSLSCKTAIAVPCKDRITFQCWRIFFQTLFLKRYVIGSCLVIS